MSEATQSPDFESIKNLSSYGAEYWSARDLAPLLGYDKWQNFEVAIKRAQTACEQVGQVVENHFTGASKMVKLGSRAEREVKDFILSRFACYLIAQNGDPRKPEIATAQAYFAVATRKNELAELKETQEVRLYLREQVGESNKALNEAARRAGVLSKNFGQFQDAGYRGLYGGLDTDGIKARKNIKDKENVLDRMGREELAANLFRITQTEAKLIDENIIGQAKAIETHHEVGRKVRKAIEDIGGTMPEELPTEATIKPLLAENKRKQKKLAKSDTQATVSLHLEEPKPNNKEIAL